MTEEKLILQNVLDMFNIKETPIVKNQYVPKVGWNQIVTDKMKLNIHAPANDLKILYNNRKTELLKYCVMGTTAVVIFRTKGNTIAGFKFNMLASRAYSSFQAERYYKWERAFEEIKIIKMFARNKLIESEDNLELDAIIMANKMVTK